jgi:hypothetical protein
MFAKVVEGVWTPGIGDPSIGGWLTVAGYFTAAFMAFVTARRFHSDARNGSPRAQAWFWLIGSGLLLLLGINKQLDLQTGMTWLLKQWALTQGWYEQRRTFQAVFISGIGIAAAGMLGWLLWLVRRDLRRHWLALAGAVFLVSFVVIRAASFHYVDRMLGMSLGGLKVNWILEWSGIACVLLGARMAWRTAPGASSAVQGDQ